MTTMTTAELDEIKPVTEYLRSISHGRRRDAFDKLAGQLPVRVFTRVKYAWTLWARREQLPPDHPWHIWLLLAGRGFGKTRVGAEWVRARAESGLSRRIALVARTPHEAESVMINGESGILAVCPPWDKPNWEPTTSDDSPDSKTKCAPGRSNPKTPQTAWTPSSGPSQPSPNSKPASTSGSEKNPFPQIPSPPGRGLG